MDTEYLYQEDRDTPNCDDERNPRLANSDVRFRDTPAERDSDDENICTTPGCTLHKHSDSVPHSFEQLNHRRRSTRNQNPNYIELIVEDVDGQALTLTSDTILGEIPTPSTYIEAIKSRLGKRWRESMEKEITDLMKNGTWEEVDIASVPRGRKITKSRWVYTIKHTTVMGQLRD